MSEPAEDFDTVKKRVLAEVADMGFKSKKLPFKEAMDLREYAKARTDIHSENLAIEQAVWKSVYECLTEELRDSFPDSMPEIEALEKRRDNLQNLEVMMVTKMKARPHDFGIRVWWGFVIIGLLVGWIRSSDIWSILVYGAAFWIAGMFLCILALDSAEVQSKIAIVLYHKLGERRVSEWLYRRALTIR